MSTMPPSRSCGNHASHAPICHAEWQDGRFRTRMPHQPKPHQGQGTSPCAQSACTATPCRNHQAYPPPWKTWFVYARLPHGVAVKPFWNTHAMIGAWHPSPNSPLPQFCRPRARCVAGMSATAQPCSRCSAMESRSSRFPRQCSATTTGTRTWGRFR